MPDKTSKELISVVAEEIAHKFTQWLGVPMQYRVGKSNRILVEPSEPVREYLLDWIDISRKLPGNVVHLTHSEPGPLRQKRINITTIVGGQLYTVRVKLQYAEGRTALLKNCGREYAITRECSLLAYTDQDEVGVRTTLGRDFDKLMAQAINDGLDPKEPWVVPFIAGIAKMLNQSPTTPS